MNFNTEIKSWTFERIFYLAIPFLILISFINLFLPTRIATYFSEAVMLFSLFFAFVFSILSIKVNKNIEFKNTTFFISLFLFLFFIASVLGQIIFLKIEVITLTYYSLWIIAYIPLYYIGIKTSIRYYEYLKQKDIIIILGFSFLLIIILIIMLGYVIIPYQSPILSPLQIFLIKIFLFLYPLLNLGIIILMLFPLNIYKSGFMSEYWLFITLGIIMFGISEIISTYNFFYGQYLFRSLVISFQILSYFIFTIGFIWVFTSKSDLIKIMPKGEYQAKEIFLIHNNGIALCHVNVEKTTVKIDEQMLTSMLTAIQDFVKTSFNVKGIELKEIYYGSFVMSIENGNYVSIAVISLGKLTKQVHDSMIQTIKIIEENYLNELKNFDGDIGKFESVKKELLDLVS